MTGRGRVIEARYPGTCPECGGRIAEGDTIRLDEYGIDEAEWRHDVCPDQPDPLDAGNPVCQTCWLAHPKGACDR